LSLLFNDNRDLRASLAHDFANFSSNLAHVAVDSPALFMSALILDFIGRTANQHVFADPSSELLSGVFFLEMNNINIQVEF
jgi:hypothetical protein